MTMGTQVEIPGVNRGTTSPTDARPRADRALIAFGVLAVGAIAFVLVGIAGESPPPLPTIGPSMTPTILSGSVIEVDTHAYDGATPEVGDIVALQGPANTTTGVCGEPHPATSPCPVTIPGYEQIRLVKRIVAAPGDRVAFQADGHIVRNGQVADEPFINPCPGDCALPNPIVVPADHFFVAGDNRPDSTDSRVFGAVPAEAIDGKVILNSTGGAN